MADQVLVLAVAHEDLAEHLAVVHAATEHARALHAATVIGEGDGTVGDHIAHLGHGLALKTAGHGARRIDAAVTDLGSTGLDELHDGAVIGDGIGVGHGTHAGKAALGSCAGAALDVLFDLVAGLAKVNVHVYQTGDEVLAGKVADLGPLDGEILADFGDLVAVNQDVNDTVKLDGRVDDVGFLRSKAIIRAPPSSRYRIAIRTRYRRRPAPDDGAWRVVGHIGVELDAAVDGARVADDRVGLHELLAVLGQAEELVVLANGRERGTLEALLLHAQHVDDVQLGQDGIEVARHVVAAQDLGRRRQQRAGGDGVGLAAMILRAGISEPQTREWAISPTTATFRPWKSPLCSQMVYRSSRACVGWLCLPSPAQMTLAGEFCVTM